MSCCVIPSLNSGEEQWARHENLHVNSSGPAFERRRGDRIGSGSLRDSRLTPRRFGRNRIPWSSNIPPSSETCRDRTGPVTPQSSAPRWLSDSTHARSSDVSGIVPGGNRVVMKRARVASQIVDPVNQYPEVDENVEIGLAQRNRERGQRITNGPAIDLGDRQMRNPRDDCLITSGRDRLQYRQEAHRREGRKKVSGTVVCFYNSSWP